MKAAKKRYHKKIPEFWKVLTRTQSPPEDISDRMVGYFYCPYIPMMIYKKNEANKKN